MFTERPGGDTDAARGDIYTRKLIRHAYVAGHGSWAYWQRAGGDGPYLVVTPMGRTKVEYFDSSGSGPSRAYTPYIHARTASEAAIADGGDWRLPVTGLKLAPRGSSGDTVTYAFRFAWARDFAAVRDVLYAQGKFDIGVVPGMVVPSDLEAMFSLRTKNAITAVEAEHRALLEAALRPSSVDFAERARELRARTRRGKTTDSAELIRVDRDRNHREGGEACPARDDHRCERRALHVRDGCRDLVTAPVSRMAIADFLASAAHMALEINHPVSDCLYLAAAQLQDTRLITADRRFVEKVAAHPYLGLRINLLSSAI